MEERIKEELARIVGQDNLSDKLIDLIAYSYDASSLSGRPDLAVWVESTEQVSKLLADGSIMRTGTRTIKSSSGLDLTRLFVGSEGTLGVVTEVTLKISPLPKEIITAMASFDRLEDAGGAVTGLMHSGVIPAVLELLDKATINLFREHSDLDLPEVEAMILLEVHGNTPDDVAFQMERTAEVFSACQVRELKVARTEEEAERLWLVRKSIGGLTGKISASQAPEDVTVPMSRITDFLRRSEEISQKHGLLILNYGHAGDGNLHPNVLYDQADPDQVARMERALTELHELAVELKGTLTGEHGIGLTKAAHMHLEHDPVAMRTMRAIKRTLDPHNILNPGKMDLDG